MMTRNSGFRFICYMHGGFDGDLFVVAYTRVEMTALKERESRIVTDWKMNED